MFNDNLDYLGGRIKLAKSEYPKVALGAAVIFGVIVLYVFELKHFDLVLNPKLLLAYAFGFGLILGIILGRKLSREVTDAYEKMRIYMMLIVLSIAFMPLLVNLANRLLDFKNPEIKDVSFENAEAYISEKYGVLQGEDVKIAGYKIVVVMDGTVLQLKSKHNPFPNNQPGDIVKIAVHRGLLGIHYVSLNNT